MRHAMGGRGEGESEIEHRGTYIGELDGAGITGAAMRRKHLPLLNIDATNTEQPRSPPPQTQRQDSEEARKHAFRG